MTEERRIDPLLAAFDEFPRSYRFKMVAAYPVLSGVPDVYGVSHHEIDEGFWLLLLARNLRRTHEMYLADLRARKP